MSYTVQTAYFTCDWPEKPCPVEFAGTVKDARDAGWYIGEADDPRDLCPIHMIAIPAVAAVMMAAPPLDEAWPEPIAHEDIAATFAAPAPPCSEDGWAGNGFTVPPSGDGLGALGAGPGTQRLYDALTAPAEDNEVDPGDERWLARYLRRWTSVAGRHAAPRSHPARDRATIDAGQ